mmetsp:Transcript_26031/g.36488  ORF Transcript_26031/g.36488 Transcript_26031/m.36488 type:complete len:207 (-) Transcript_26031:1700-2320(-)
MCPHTFWIRSSMVRSSSTPVSHRLLLLVHWGWMHKSSILDLRRSLWSTSFKWRRGVGSILMQPAPNLSKECLLGTKFHFGTFIIVVSSQFFQCVLDFLGALTAAHHMIVQDIESLRSVAQRFNRRWEESSTSVPTKAMPASQSSKTRRQSLALTKTISFRKNTWLHLTQKVVREFSRVWLIFKTYKRRRLGQIFGLTICPFTINIS